MKLTTLLNALTSASWNMVSTSLPPEYAHNRKHYWSFHAALLKRLVVADGCCATCAKWNRFCVRENCGWHGWGSCTYPGEYGMVSMRNSGWLDTHEVHGCRAWRPTEDTHE